MARAVVNCSQTGYDWCVTDSTHTILCFGTFDFIHAGHRHFLRHAKQLGDRLVVVIARDGAARHLKGRAPLYGEDERRLAVASLGLADEVVLGDTDQGSWSTLHQYRPDTVAIGYDQEELARALARHIKKRRLPCSLVRLKAYKPQTFKSSILKNRVRVKEPLPTATLDEALADPFLIQEAEKKEEPVGESL